MKQIKVRVFGEWIEKVQKHAFSIGFSFSDSYNEVDFSSNFLLFDSNLKLIDKIIAHDAYDYFICHQAQELTPEQFLRLTKDDFKEEREFDIEPFDKVLVKGSKKGKWKPQFYQETIRHYNEFCDSSYVTFKCIDLKHYTYIIKYTPELKKYIGTTSDIPGSFKK